VSVAASPAFFVSFDHPRRYVVPKAVDYENEEDAAEEEENVLKASTDTRAALAAAALRAAGSSGRAAAATADDDEDYDGDGGAAAGPPAAPVTAARLPATTAAAAAAAGAAPRVPGSAAALPAGTVLPPPASALEAAARTQAALCAAAAAATAGGVGAPPSVPAAPDGGGAAVVPRDPRMPLRFSIVLSAPPRKRPPPARRQRLGLLPSAAEGVPPSGGTALATDDIEYLRTPAPPPSLDTITVFLSTEAGAGRGGAAAPGARPGGDDAAAAADALDTDGEEGADEDEDDASAAQPLDASRPRLPPAVDEAAAYEMVQQAEWEAGIQWDAGAAASDSSGSESEGDFPMAAADAGSAAASAVGAGAPAAAGAAAATGGAVGGVSADAGAGAGTSAPSPPADGAVKPSADSDDDDDDDDDGIIWEDDAAPPSAGDASAGATPASSATGGATAPAAGVDGTASAPMAATLEQPEADAAGAGKETKAGDEDEDEEDDDDGIIWEDDAPPATPAAAPAAAAAAAAPAVSPPSSAKPPRPTPMTATVSSPPPAAAVAAATAPSAAKPPPLIRPPAPSSAKPPSSAKAAAKAKPTEPLSGEAGGGAKDAPVTELDVRGDTKPATLAWSPVLSVSPSALVARPLEPNHLLASGVWMDDILWDSSGEDDSDGGGGGVALPHLGADGGAARRALRSRFSRLILDLNDPAMVFHARRRSSLYSPAAADVSAVADLPADLFAKTDGALLGGLVDKAGGDSTKVAGERAAAAKAAAAAAPARSKAAAAAAAAASVAAAAAAAATAAATASATAASTTDGSGDRDVHAGALAALAPGEEEVVLPGARARVLLAADHPPMTTAAETAAAAAAAASSAAGGVLAVVDPLNVSNDVFYGGESGGALSRRAARRSPLRGLNHAPPAAKAMTIPPVVSDAELVAFHRPTLGLLSPLPSGQALVPIRRKRPKEGPAQIACQMPKRRSDLSCAARDAYRVALFEYSLERQPALLPIPGMACRLVTYARKASVGAAAAASAAAAGTPDADTVFLAPEEPPPLGSGDLPPDGPPLVVVESGLFAAPASKVAGGAVSAGCDFLVIKRGNKVSVREIDSVVSVGVTEPRVDSMAPGTERAKRYARDRVLLWMSREFSRLTKKAVERPSVDKEELLRLFWRRRSFPETTLLKVLRELTFYERGRYVINEPPRGFATLEAELLRTVTPEESCAFEAMESGVATLMSRGVSMFTYPNSHGNLLGAADRTTLAHGRAIGCLIRTLLLHTPWHRTSTLLGALKAQRKDLLSSLSTARALRDLCAGGPVLDARLLQTSAPEALHLLTAHYRISAKKVPADVAARKALLRQVATTRGRPESARGDYADIIGGVLARHREASSASGGGGGSGGGSGGGRGGGGSAAAAASSGGGSTSGGTSTSGGIEWLLPLPLQRGALEAGKVHALPRDRDTAAALAVEVAAEAEIAAKAAPAAGFGVVSVSVIKPRPSASSASVGGGSVAGDDPFAGGGDGGLGGGEEKPKSRRRSTGAGRGRKNAAAGALGVAIKPIAKGRSGTAAATTAAAAAAVADGGDGDGDGEDGAYSKAKARRDGKVRARVPKGRRKKKGLDGSTGNFEAADEDGGAGGIDGVGDGAPAVAEPARPRPTPPSLVPPPAPRGARGTAPGEPAGGANKAAGDADDGEDGIDGVDGGPDTAVATPGTPGEGIKKKRPSKQLKVTSVRKNKDGTKRKVVTFVRDPDKIEAILAMNKRRKMSAGGDAATGGGGGDDKATSGGGAAGSGGDGTGNRDGAVTGAPRATPVRSFAPPKPRSAPGSAPAAVSKKSSLKIAINVNTLTAGGTKLGAKQRPPMRPPSPVLPGRSGVGTADGGGLAGVAGSGGIGGGGSDRTASAVGGGGAGGSRGTFRPPPPRGVPAAARAVGKIKINTKIIDAHQAEAEARRRRNQYGDDEEFPSRRLSGGAGGSSRGGGGDAGGAGGSGGGSGRGGAASGATVSSPAAADVGSSRRSQRNGVVLLNNILEQMEAAVRNAEGYIVDHGPPLIIKRVRPGEPLPPGIVPANLARPGGTGLDFTLPVSPKAVPRYREIVRRPMYLNLLRAKARKGQYHSAALCMEDMELLVKNARLFNSTPDVQWVVQHAELLAEVAADFLAGAKPQIDAAEALIAREDAEMTSPGALSGRAKDRSVAGRSPKLSP